jgi:hypothetical protein
MANDNQPVSAPPRRRRGRVRAFWGKVSGGLELERLWHQFLSEARSSYGLHSRDVDWDEIGRERKRWKRPFRIAGALFQAMLMKLTPARRVILPLAIVLLLVEGKIHTGKSDVTINLGAIDAVLLFIVLALELADRVTHEARPGNRARNSARARARSAFDCPRNGYRLCHATAKHSRRRLL